MITIPGKIPIRIHPLFWLVAFFIAWMVSFNLTLTLLLVGVIFVSVLFHECGHALTAMAFKQEVRIELAAFGGFTYRQGPKLKLWEEFIVVLNGPAAGLLLGLIAFFVVRHTAIENVFVRKTLEFTALANFFWTVINLVPVLPLDGGHLLSIILEGIFGFRGIKMAIIIGLGVSVAISLFFFLTGRWLIGALFLILTFESFRSLRYYKLFKEQDRDTDLQELLSGAQKDVEEERIDSALAKFEEVRSRSGEGILFTVATQQMTEIYRKQERYEEAYALLKPLRKVLSAENLPLYHFLAFQNRDYETVIDMGNQCYQNSPSYETAVINALAYGALGKPEPAIGWIECATREGLPHPKETLQKQEFDPIRTDPQFRALTEKYIS